MQKPTQITRRQLLQYGAIAAGSLLLPTVGYQVAGAARTAGSPYIKPFSLPFKPLPLLYPVRSDATTDYYLIRIAAGQTQMLPGFNTNVWTYNGTVPGPLIRQRKGRRSVVRFSNRLNVPTSTHLHGMAALPQYDGWANDLIPPQYYKDYIYPNNRAAFLWYHDHAVMNTARNTYMGLAGCYIVQDDFELNLPLPKGNYDVPLFIQDRTFDQTGQPVFNDAGIGFMGDVILVNGVPWPRMSVARRRYRFRILNASSTRAYRLKLNTGKPFMMIGTDAGLMGTYVPTNELRIGPGERYEFVLNFAQYPIGTQIVLQNLSLPDNEDFDNTNVVMRFDVVANAVDDSYIPAQLRPYNPIPESSAVTTRTWDFDLVNDVWVLNGKTWDPNRMDAEVNLNDVEIWKFTHPHPMYHMAHVHLVDAQILSRNGQPPAPYERGWKDVFYVGPFEEVRVITKFGPYLGKYMMHCHMTTHEDNDMMVGWEVVRRDSNGTVIERGTSPMAAPAKPLSQWVPL